MAHRRTVLLLVVVAAVAGWRLHQRSHPRVPTAILVQVTHPCDADKYLRQFGDDRIVIANFRADGALFLNETPESEKAFRETVRLIYSTRETKQLWFTGDRASSYGRVVRSISQLKLDTPDLTLITLTESQIKRPARFDPRTGFKEFQWDCISE